MGKKIAMAVAIERLRDKGWKTKLDDRYLTAFQEDGSAYQMVPAPGDRIELNDVRAVPQYAPQMKRR